MPASVNSWSSFSAALASRVRVASIQASSARARSAMAMAGPDTAHGPKAALSFAARSGAASAKPSRNPARPKNFPKDRSTMMLPRCISPAKLASSGPTSMNASSTARRPPRPLKSSDNASSLSFVIMRPSGLFGLTITARSTRRSSLISPTSMTACPARAAARACSE
jgi:hypothetical protein